MTGQRTFKSCAEYEKNQGRSEKGNNFSAVSILRTTHASEGAAKAISNLEEVVENKGSVSNSMDSGKKCNNSTRTTIKIEKETAPIQFIFMMLLFWLVFCFY